MIYAVLLIDERAHCFVTDEYGMALCCDTVEEMRMMLKGRIDLPNLRIVELTEL